MTSAAPPRRRPARRPRALRPHPRSRHARPLPRALLVTVTALALGATPWTATAAVPAASRPTAPDVVLDWNRITHAVVHEDAERYTSEQTVWHGLVSAAVYNAVVGVEGRYTPYKWHGRAPRGASSEAAAAAAAHRVLWTYFPRSRARVDRAYADSLARIPDGPAELLGVAFGERAAAHVVGLRRGDGRTTAMAYDRPPAPGVWRPTPPEHKPFHVPWLARLRPLVVESPDQFLPGPPPALTSRRYARDVAEVRALGAKDGSARTPRQTETARFFADVLTRQFQDAHRGYVRRHGLDIVEASRLFAAANTAMADATITAWNAKFGYGQWRPVTAIRLADTDGNPATEADPSWTPLLRTPPYADYVSGHNAIDGAVVGVLDRLTGGDIDLRISSKVTGTTRTYTRSADFDRDVIDARVLGGIHFRTSDEVGNRMGRQIARWTMDHHFRPVG
ncbi:vanadium-dependent haloperoxidase [Streptomyces sp. enrichment culture]|uniref:vanadium-dependent haloperoxidase n=1 Tax=Streptomyces sp. enrichment culture TaxID=1795815 RepID=UPI003F5795C9